MRKKNIEVGRAISEKFSYKSLLALCVRSYRISYIPWHYRNGI